MAEARFDALGVGNAIVDVLAHADDAFLNAHGLAKGSMTLIDEDAVGRLYDAMGPAIECSGGSAANTIAGLASLGGSGAFIGKVRDDEMGAFFRHDIRALGITFETLLADDGAPTARCLILVTPDAQRTMQTYLGACVELGPDDIDPDLVADAEVCYLEGYLWDRPLAKEAFLKAARIAHQAGRRVSLSLSDPFCVDRHRADFLSLVEDHVDVLFANEEEVLSLYQVETFDAALQWVRGHCEIAALTRGEKGSVIVSGDEVHVVDAEPVERIVDTTGAGDAYAAGFLHGLNGGRDLAACARIGGVGAAEVIAHMGARPETSLQDEVARRLP
ncbi:MAG: adenosine kinase [Rhodospirillales bacterium]|nr:adenosine kinase [Rhodospirillales bacterium]HJO72647.1 adenosine kinase [Rhodospirillales bacterium]